MDVVVVEKPLSARPQPRQCRVTAGSLLASVLLHATAFGGVWLLDAWDFIDVQLLPVQSGRASVALAASMPAEATQRADDSEQQISAALVAEATRQAASPLAAGSPEPQVEPVGRRTLPSLLARPAGVPIPELDLNTAVNLTRRQELFALGDGADESPIATAPEVSMASEPARRQLVQADVDSRASKASAASAASAGAEGDRPASVLANPPPVYPPSALAARQTGRVVLRVTVTVDGRAARATVHRSSGIASLDAAALAAVRSWRFVPARQGGVPVQRDIAVPVRFALAD